MAILVSTANFVGEKRFAGETEEYTAECDGGRDNKELSIKCEYDLSTGTVVDIDCTIEFCDNNSCDDDDGYALDVAGISRKSIGAGLFDIVYDLEADPIQDDFLDDYLIDADFFLTFTQECDASTGDCELIAEGELTCNTVVPNPLSGVTIGSQNGQQRAACAGVPGWRDSFGDPCTWYVDKDEPGCPLWGNEYTPTDGEFAGIPAKVACCYCQEPAGP